MNTKIFELRSEARAAARELRGCEHVRVERVYEACRLSGFIVTASCWDSRRRTLCCDGWLR